MTHQGTPKMLYFNASLPSGRWDRFLPKILHVIGTPEKYDEAVAATPYLLATKARCATCARCAPHPVPAAAPVSAATVSSVLLPPRSERSMHYVPVYLFKMSSHQIARSLLDEVVNATADALALQNDEDEMISGTVLHHLRHCEARTPPPYYAPASSYKGSFDWMLRRFKGGDVARRFVEQHQQLLPNETKLGAGRLPVDAGPARPVTRQRAAAKWRPALPKARQPRPISQHAAPGAGRGGAPLECDRPAAHVAPRQPCKRQ